jgi:hypothetical protein
MSAEIRQYLQLLIDLLKALAWPATLIALVFWFRDSLQQAISQSRETVIEMAGAKIRITAQEAVDAVSDVFSEVDTILREHLTTEERQLFSKIVKAPHTLTVKDIFPEFKRETPEHKMLRALRGVFFIRPVERGGWQPFKRVEVTTFGRLVAHHRLDLLSSPVPGAK